MIFFSPQITLIRVDNYQYKKDRYIICFFCFSVKSVANILLQKIVRTKYLTGIITIGNL